MTENLTNCSTLIHQAAKLWLQPCIDTLKVMNVGEITYTETRILELLQECVGASRSNTGQPFCGAWVRAIWGDPNSTRCWHCEGSYSHRIELCHLSLAVKVHWWLFNNTKKSSVQDPRQVSPPPPNTHSFQGTDWTSTSAAWMYSSPHSCKITSPFLIDPADGLDFTSFVTKDLTL